MTYDDTDKATASAIEAAVKDANVNGIEGYTEPVMTEAQYTPDVTGIAPTMPRDFNRDQAVAVVGVLRSVPVRFPVCSLASLPQPIAGGAVYVSDGAAGSACLAFSDGVAWRRCDTLDVVG